MIVYLPDQKIMRIDFLDTHSKRFTACNRVMVEDAVRLFLYSFPPLFLRMLSFREFVAAKIGLKTANGRTAILKEIESFRGKPGEKIALFEVWRREENTVVTGQQDKHLDFALVFTVEQDRHTCLVSLTTAVQINSSLGKVYFFLVRPFHSLIMPVVVKRLALSLAS